MHLPPAISTFRRESQIEELAREHFDLVVIGGGITGAGLAREASLRGLRVALLEGADFAAGTSSRSSKLIHGGLRYLAHLEFGLVQKAAIERKEIRRLAPHLTEPRWMVLPLRSRSALLFSKLAVATYEKLGDVAKEDLQQIWSGETLACEEPVVDRKAFPYALAYREYLTDDARLVLANLRSAVEHGACVLNYARVTSFTVEGQRADGVEVCCERSGATFRVRGKVLVNAAGPWVEDLQRLENPQARPLLHLSKGIHVVLPATVLPIRNLIVLRSRDKRRIFALRRDDVVYLGTTDTTYDRAAEHWPEVSGADVDYLLEPLARHFSTTACTRQHVIATWAGLRPLIAQSGTDNPSELSRRDEILVGPLGVISIAGGKLTGFREMAQRVFQRVVESVSPSMIYAQPQDDLPLPGGNLATDRELSEVARGLALRFCIDESAARRVARLYGSEAENVLALGPTPLYAGARAFEGEVAWALQYEGALTLEDVLYRRLRLPYFDLDADTSVIPVAQLLAKAMHWTDANRNAQVAATIARLAADRLLPFEPRSLQNGAAIMNDVDATMSNAFPRRC
jgi:glycerol-3-phosphate dehydrogenase